MTPAMRVASTGMHGMHIYLPVPLMFKIEKIVLMLGPHGLYLVWT